MNLLGYCEEEHPFTRVMVFEYAPNGTLFEHLHGKCIAVMSFSVSSVTKLFSSLCTIFVTMTSVLLIKV